MRRLVQIAAAAAVLAAAALWAIEAGTAAPRYGGLRETLSGTFLAGRHAESQSDLSAAADFMAESLKNDPDNPELLRRALVLLISAGRTAEALPLARRSVKREPAALIANLLLAADAMARADTDEAKAALDRVQRDSIGSIAAPLMGAWVVFAAEGTDAALEALGSARSLAPFKMLERLHAGLIAELGGRPEAARASYESVLQPDQRAPLRVVEALAGSLQRAGAGEAARALFPLHVADNPDSPLIQAVIERLGAPAPYPRLVGTPAEGVAEVLFGIGTGLFRQSENGMALVLGRLALHARPDFPLGLVFVAEILEGMRRYEDAMALYGRVEPASPFAWETRQRAASDLAELKRDAEAIRILETMAAERPGRADALLRLGNLLRDRERYDEAIAAYDEAIRRLGQPEPAHWAAYYARGMALERAKRYDRAGEDLTRALEYRPDHAYVLNYLGYMWIDLGRDLERASAMIKRAVELKPDDGFIVDSLGWYHYRVGDYERAVALLERAVELKPADPVINDHLGDAYWQIGRRTEARYQWWRALGFEAPADVAAIIRAKLEKGLGAAPAAGKG